MLILHFQTIFTSCFVTTLISLQTIGKTVNNYSLTTIRYTKQKRHSLIPFKNNGTLQKWHMTNTPPEIDKYDTHKSWYFTKMAHLAKNCPKVTFAKD